MRKLFGKLILFIPVMLLVISINYCVDPAYLFKNKGYLVGIADLLLNGRNVGNVSNFDERLLQKYYIDRSRRRKDVIVLGSSRAMQIGGELFQGKDFFNHSVPGATIEDLMAIFNMYDQKNMSPKLIVLAVDPWIFNKHNGANRWGSVREYYYGALKEQKLSVPVFEKAAGFISEKYLQLFSFSYFQDALERLYLIWRGKLDSHYFPTEKSEDDYDILLADGTRSVSKEERLRTSQQALELAKAYVQKRPVFQLGSFQEIDKFSVKEFESFIHLLRSKNIKVIIFLAPYNPFVYDYLIQSDQYKIIRDVETYIREFVRKENIEIKGSYNPHPYALTQSDFYDGMHAKRETIMKLLQNSL